MANDLFDGISIDSLASSEEAILDVKKLSGNEGGNSTARSDEKKEKEEAATRAKAKEDENKGISLADLAGADEEESSLDTDETGNTKKTQTPGSNGSTDSPSSQSALTSLASALHETGVLSSLTKEELEKVTSTEELLEAVSKQIKSNELADLTEDQKSYLTAMRNGVPHETYSQRRSNAEQYKSIPEEALEENTALCAELIKRSFVVKGIDIQTATKFANKAIEEDDGGIAEALKARDMLVKFEEDSLKDEVAKREKERSDRLKEEDDKLSTLKSKINETTEVLPGIKINSQTKDKIFSSMTSPVKEKSGKLQNEVMDLYSSDLEYKMKLHALHVLTKGFTDFSKFKAEAKTKAVRELEEKLNSGKNGIGITGSQGKHNSGAAMTSRQIVEALPDFSKK